MYLLTESRNYLAESFYKKKTNRSSFGVDLLKLIVNKSVLATLTADLR